MIERTAPIAEATAFGDGALPSSAASATERAWSSSVRMCRCCHKIPRSAVPASTRR